MSEDGLARDTGWELLAAVVSAPAAFGVSVVLARWLDPTANGQVQAALSMLVVLGYAVQLGWVAAVVVRLRRGGTAPALVATHALGTVGLQAAGAASLLWAAREPVQRLLVGAPEGVLLAVLVALPLALWLQTLGGLARGLGRFSLWSRARVIDQVGRLAVLLALVVWLRPDPVVAMVGIAGAQALSTGVLAVSVLRGTGLALRVDPAEWATSARYGLTSFVHTLAGQLHERVDLFLLAWWVGDPVEVAWYAVAVGVVNRVRTLPLALASALFPRLAGLSPEASAALAARATRHAMLWVVLSTGVLLAVAPFLLPLVYGEAYAGSVAPFLVLLPATALFSLYLILGRWFQARDRQRVNVVAQGAAVLLNVGLNAWLIPRYGAVGAAWASLVSYGLQGLWVLAAFVSTTGTSWRRTLVVDGDDLRWYVDRVRSRLS